MTLLAFLAALIGVVSTVFGLAVMVFLTNVMLWPTSEARTEPDYLRMVGTGVLVGCSAGAALIVAGAPSLACLVAIPVAAVFGVLFSTGALTVGAERARLVPTIVMSGVALLSLTAAAAWRWGF